MPELVKFPDVVDLVISEISARLVSAGVTSAPVGGEPPSGQSTRFVVVFRTGGPRGSLVADDAQVTVDSYGIDAGESFELASAARSIIGALPALTDWCQWVTEFAGPADLPNPNLASLSRQRQTFTVSAALNSVKVV